MSQGNLSAAVDRFRRDAESFPDTAVHLIKDQQVHCCIHSDDRIDPIVSSIGTAAAHIAPCRLPFGIQLFPGPGFRRQDVLFPPGRRHLFHDSVIQGSQAGRGILPGTDKDQGEIFPSQLGRHVFPDGFFAFFQAQAFLINQVRFIPHKDAGLPMGRQLAEQFRISLMEFVREYAQE